MFLKNGHIAWPLFLALVYCTLVVISTDLAWRLFDGPFLLFAGSGAAALLAGCCVLFFVGRRQ